MGVGAAELIAKLIEGIRLCGETSENAPGIGTDASCIQNGAATNIGNAMTICNTGIRSEAVVAARLLRNGLEMAMSNMAFGISWWYYPVTGHCVAVPRGLDY